MSNTRTSYDYSVVVCGSCDGKGYTTRDVLTDYHRREYDTEMHKCCRCEGSGRLECKVTTETWPLVPREVQA